MRLIFVNFRQKLYYFNLQIKSVVFLHLSFFIKALKTILIEIIVMKLYRKTSASAKRFAECKSMAEAQFHLIFLVIISYTRTAWRKYNRIFKNKVALNALAFTIGAS